MPIRIVLQRRQTIRESQHLAIATRFGFDELMAATDILKPE